MLSYEQHDECTTLRDCSYNMTPTWGPLKNVEGGDCTVENVLKLTMHVFSQTMICKPLVRLSSIRTEQ